MKKNSVFDDYIAGLKQLDNENNRVELENYYALHSAVFQYFKAIDKSIQDVLSKPIVSPIIVEQLKIALPTLNKLKSEIAKLDTETFAAGHKTKITNTAARIKTKMSLSEVGELSQELFSLLKWNKEAKITWQKKLDESSRKVKEQAEAEKARRAKLAKPQNVTICTKNVGPFEYGTVSRNHSCFYCGQTLTFFNYGEFQCPACKKSLSLLINYTCKHCGTLISINDIAHRYNDASFNCPKCNKRCQLSQEFLITLPKQNNDSWCFVATACYGNYDAPEVLVLRRYRDERLLTNWLGTLFVRFYYFISPPLARQIEKSESAKKCIRQYFLRPIIEMIQSRTTK